MANKPSLNKRERLLLFNLHNLGSPVDELCTFFNISAFTHRSIRRELRKTESTDYTAEEMGSIMTEYLLTSLARNIHSLPMEMQLRYLPDLLKIKAGNNIDDADSTRVELYIPKKIKHKKEEEIILEDNRQS